MAAALGWTRVGPVAAVSDTQNADVLREPTSKQHEALVDILGPLLGAAIADYPALADYFEAEIDEKVAGLDIALKSSFSTTGQTGLFTIPNGSVPSATPTLTDVSRVDPSLYAANQNLAGQSTTGTVKPITVRFGSGTSGVFSVSGEATAGDRTLRASGGTLNPVLMSVDMAGPSGMSKAVVKALNAAGQPQSIGTFIAGKFDGTTIRYFQWNISASNRAYILQKAVSDTGYAGISRTLVATSSFIAQVGDVVGVQLTPSGMLSLVVNGVESLTYQLTESEKTSYMGATNTHWGIVDDPTVTGPALGTWTAQSITYPLVTRKAVTVDENGSIPAAQLAGIETFLNSRSPQGAMFDIRKYGAKVDGRLLSSGAMTAGTNILTSGYAFTQADVGKRVAVIGARPIVAYVNGNGVLVSSIGAVINGAAILNAPAEATVANAEVMFGTVDDAAINAARDAAVAAGGGTVVFPRGKCVVSVAHLPTRGVSYMGSDRAASEVYPLKNLDESTPTGQPTQGSWLFSWETSGLNPDKKDFLYNVDVHDFTIQCRFWSAQTVYTAGLKPLNLFRLYNSHIYNMTVVDSPATAIPYDQSVASSVHHCLVIRPGRLCPPSTSDQQFGGSGIGVGTGESGQGSQWIAFNTIIGTQTATSTGVGHNGIFVEANASISLLPDGLDNIVIEPLNIIANTIIGMPFGITEAGGVGSIIADNQIVRCGIGIALRATNIKASAPGLDAVIHHNVIRDCAGPVPYDGTGILIRTIGGAAGSQNDRPNTKTALNTLIHANTILRCSGSGIVVRAGTFGIDGVRILENNIRDNGLSGIHIQRGASDPAPYRMLDIAANAIHSNGKRGNATDRSGILVDPLVQWTGGRLLGEALIYDLAATPTQVGTIVVGAGAVLTGVLKDAAPVLW
jgi:hypothetical protein